MNHEHDPGPDLDDRFLDTLLAEHEGHGPDPGLIERTLRAVATAPAPRPEAPARSRWLVAAGVLFGLAAVVAVAWQQRDGDAAPSPTPPAPADASQDPTPAPIPVLLRALGDADATTADAAQATLVRLGKAAVPELAQALADPGAARGRVLAALDAIEQDAAFGLGAITALLMDQTTPVELLAPAVRAASTLVPFAPVEVRKRARDAVLTVGFRRSGPGGLSGPANAPAALPFHDLILVGRFLHRMEVEVATEAEAIAALAGSESPFARELAARLLVRWPTPAAIAALRAAIQARHQGRVAARWEMLGAGGDFTCELDGEDLAIVPRTAARALVAIAAGKDASALGHAWLLANGSKAEQRAAATGLCGIKAAAGDQDAVTAALLVGVASSDTEVAQQAITAVGVQGSMTPELRRVLEQLRANGPAAIAALAQVVLGKF